MDERNGKLEEKEVMGEGIVEASASVSRRSKQ